MNTEIKRYVTFFIPGIIVSETSTKDINTNDPRSIEWPKNAYAFTIHEREDVINGDKRYTGQPRQIGPIYYHPDSKVETLEEVKNNPNRGPCLVSNMEYNNWDRVIWTRWGNWPQPFDESKIEVLK